MVPIDEIESEEATRVLMCPPAYFAVRDVKNPFMDPHAAVDSVRAFRQWTALRDAFVALGLSVEAIDPIEDLEDMVFAANQVFVGRGRRHKRFVVPSRMRYASRQREVAAFVTWFTQRGFDIVDLDLDARAGEFLEGHGDLMRQPNSRVIWAGHGHRSSASGVARFERAMQHEGLHVVPVELVDPTFYHLDTCLAPLNGDAALVYPGAFAPDSLCAMRNGWPRLHEVPRVDALQFVCNGVAVNGRFVASHVTPWLERVLRDEALVPLRVDTTEFEKSGGSVFCMKMLF
ncbi:MAG: amidinotransferase [Candidatus Eremiobacteraeota bacterium]|nr:amidinotransferase [Candidatus Eremiobacteraeota bacterium]